ncbi:MAG: cache domain-containing protein, partial [Fimbriimonadales bacterium]|nr:cache domain-containing protein [Fimbriimonadales bacterium]
MSRHLTQIAWTKHLSLRHRLMLLYALMALLPVLLGAGVMLLYLRHQVRNTTRQFQRETHRTLLHYQNRVERSTQQLLQRAFDEITAQTQRGLEQHQQQLVRQQEAVTGRALHQLSERTRRSTLQLQHATRQTLQRTLDDTAQQIGALQHRALERLATTATHASQEAIRAQVEQSSLSLTANLRRQVDGILRSVLAQLTLIAQQPALREQRPQESGWILQALQDREPAYRLLCLRNPEGQKLVAVSEFVAPESRLQPLVERLWQQMIASDQPVVGEVLMLDTGAGEEPLIPVLTPVRERGAELRGAVFALVAMDDLNQLVRTFRMGKQGYAMLCTSDGLILAHPERQQV